MMSGSQVNIFCLLLLFSKSPRDKMHLSVQLISKEPSLGAFICVTPTCTANISIAVVLHINGAANLFEEPTSNCV